MKTTDENIAGLWAAVEAIARTIGPNCYNTMRNAVDAVPPPNPCDGCEGNCEACPFDARPPATGDGAKHILGYPVVALERSVHELFRVNCVHYAGNYEVTPGQAQRIAKVLTESLQAKVAQLEAMRPHWAQGHTNDGVAAQTSYVALNQLWSLLGAKNQTEAVLLLKALVDK